ncbi:Hsp20 family protein [Providencia vermicola]|uniref:Hsp20 family protein n=2 Tax=Providencia TaxID=586 RepID=A0AAI9HWP9_PROST|nr:MULTISPECIES: Hsp20 family protein [Providencia]ELR5046339.1 Hsp20 family protein [Providencia rettgeri]ELR5033945.1 Hsp20 family protein [Providencia stuartii]ELR5119689.1 Hsp20 family protein [Providencia stuartii]ELR5141433.1 Hsp20 family protein [Providencia stuartii]ELR5290791.1 Hsp20 family protein [Providencia stuartii]
MANIRPFSLFPTLSDNILSNRFDQIDRLFSQLTGSKPISSPIQTYNLKQVDDNRYELTVSVPGYQESDLTVSLKGGRLLVEGKKEEKIQEDNEKWIHRGISQGQFTLQFDLGKNVQIEKADLSSGLLTINIEYELPEEEKPQMIAIENKDKQSS